MKWLLGSIPILVTALLALAFVSCTTNNPVSNTTVIDSVFVRDSIGPKITGFSPDTVWTLKPFTIYGKHFGYDPNDVQVTFDTAQAQQISAVNDTSMTVYVPEYAQSGPIRIATINGSTTSTKSVVVEYTFNPHTYTINDTLPIGASFSISGTGMNHYHGFLRLYVAGFPYPIDSVFTDRVVSHVISYGIGGNLYLSDADTGYNLGELTITRPSSWNTLSIIWDHLTVTETHHRIGYVNGPANPIDSTWQTTTTFLGQHDVNISGIPFTKTLQGLEYGLSVPSLRIIWDTITQTANVYLQLPPSQSASATLVIDTNWSFINSGTLPAPLPVQSAIEFTLLTGNFGYQITEDSSDAQGLVNWQETTSGQVTSGSFNLILKP